MKKTSVSQKVTGSVTGAILSMSLLTVMAGAAVAPALGVIKTHFAGAQVWEIQFIISLPALFIIFTNLLFGHLCKWFKSRTLAIIGLAMYVLFGSLPFLMENITLILISRALLGVSVGMIMPLSTGLLSFYFPPEKQGALMGLAAAMNQMGGVVATLLAGVLAGFSWNYAFLVYLLGLIAIALVVRFLPNERIAGVNQDENTPGLFARLKRFHPSIVGMFLCMSLFFVYPSNFAIITGQQTTLSLNAITIIMVALDVVAFFVGLFFSKLMQECRKGLKYFAPLCFLIAYSGLSFCSGQLWLLLAGSFFIGIANGAGIPYLNTIASIKGGKSAATTVMPLISASLYLGQFLSPIYISSFGTKLFPGHLNAPYIFASVISIVFLLQAFLTRNLQALPPKVK